MSRQEDFENMIRAAALKNAREIYDFCKSKKKLKKFSMDFAVMCVEFPVFFRQYKKFKKYYEERDKEVDGKDFLRWMERHLEYVEANRIGTLLESACYRFTI